MLVRSLTTSCLLLALGTAHANASPYWVAWEGDDYPENEGWTRDYGSHGPASRTLSGGMLTIDSLTDPAIFDYDRIDRPGSFTLFPGETFVAQWRVRVDQIAGPYPYDPGVAIFSDDTWDLGFEFGANSAHSTFEDAQVPYTPNAFHTFELTTSNFRSYELRIDGILARIGSFWEPAVTASYVAWGDAIEGSASLADWDYFRFGIVPEPPSAAAAVLISVGFRFIRGAR